MAPCSSTPSSPASRARRAPSANAATTSLMSAIVIRSHSKPCSGSRLSVELCPFGYSRSGNVALPAAVTELHDELAVVLVDRRANRAPERDALVAVDRRVVRNDAPARMHRHERRDDRADAASGELQFPVDARLVAGAVVVVEAPGDVGAEHPVLDRQIPEGRAAGRSRQTCESSARHAAAAAVARAEAIARRVARGARHSSTTARLAPSGFTASRVRRCRHRSDQRLDKSCAQRPIKRPPRRRYLAPSCGPSSRRSDVMLGPPSVTSCRFSGSPIATRPQADAACSMR